MNLTELRRFLMAVDMGSLNKAAEKLHVTQPAITRSLQMLEQQFGVPLLTRSAGGVELTDFGRAVYFRARLIESELERLNDDIATLHDLSGGKVHIGAPPGPGLHTDILPTAIRHLSSSLNRVSIQITMGTREQLLPLLRRGNLDFFVGLVEYDESSGDLLQENLFEDRNVLVVAKTHPFNEQSIDLADLLRQTWYVMSESAALERMLMTQARMLGLVFEKNLVFSDSAQLVKSAISHGEGVGFLRFLTCQKEIKNGVLRELKHDFRGMLQPELFSMGLISRRDGQMPAAVEMFMQELRQACRKMVLPV